LVRKPPPHHQNTSVISASRQTLRSHTEWLNPYTEPPRGRLCHVVGAGHAKLLPETGHEHVSVPQHLFPDLVHRIGKGAVQARMGRIKGRRPESVVMLGNLLVTGLSAIVAEDLAVRPGQGEFEVH